MFALLIPAIMWVGHKVFGALEPTMASVIEGKLANLSNTPGLLGDILTIFKESGVQTSTDKENEFNLHMNSLLGNLQIDNTEAASENRFDSGWRPFIAWVCGLALAMSILVEPTINYLLGFFKVAVPAPFVLAPVVMALITGLCGIYMGSRTVEKIRGVN